MTNHRLGGNICNIHMIYVNTNIQILYQTKIYQEYAELLALSQCTHQNNMLYTINPQFLSIFFKI
jgi:hypothetical protein